jgi:hypothetical protein
VADRILALYGSVGQADADPTAAQASAATALSQSLPGLVGQWRSIVGQRVPALNQRLKEARLPSLDPEAPPSRKEEGADRDEG